MPPARFEDQAERAPGHRARSARRREHSYGTTLRAVVTGSRHGRSSCCRRNRRRMRRLRGRGGGTPES